MIVAVTASLCAGGCSAPTLVRATVDGPAGVTAIFVDLDFDAVRKVTHQPLLRNGAVPSLPATFGVKLPDAAGTLSITVTAPTTAGDVLTATSAVAVAPHHTEDVTLSLGSVALDAAVGAPDLSSKIPDLSSSPDLKVAPDLAALPDVCHQTGAATACALGSYLLCDGFEGDSGTMFLGWTDSVSANGSVAAATTPVCRGVTSMHAHVSGGAQAARIYRNALALGMAAYVRTFLYIPTGTDWTTLSYGDYYEFGDGSGGTVNIRFGGTEGKIYVERSFAANEPEVGTLPRAQWICLEMYVAFSSTAGHVTLWINEAMVADYPSIPTLNPAGNSLPTFLALGENGTLSGSTGMIDLYVDEVVVSTTPIGCH